MNARSKAAIVAAPVTAIAILGFGAGESPDRIGLGGVLASLVAGPVIAAAVAWILCARLRLGGRKLRLGIAAAAVLLVAAGVMIGSELHTRAYNRCRTDGIAIQHELSAYRAATGRYPLALPELGLQDLPSRVWPRGSILRYQSDGTTYRLSFTDSFVTHDATNEGTGFFASK